MLRAIYLLVTLTVRAIGGDAGAVVESPSNPKTRESRFDGYLDGGKPETPQEPNVVQQSVPTIDILHVLEQMPLKNIEYSPDSKPKQKGTMDYFKYSPDSSPKLKGTKDCFANSPRSKLETSFDMSDSSDFSSESESENQTKAGKVTLEFPEYRDVDTYRLIGKEAEAAYFTRNFGFFNPTYDERSVTQFITLVAQGRKNYEVRSLELKNFNKLHENIRVRMCGIFINNNVVLRQEQISFDRPEDTNSIRVVHKYMNYSIQIPRQKIRVIGCPAKNDVTSEKMMLYIIPVIYVDPDKEHYVFVFKDDNSKENSSKNIKLEMLSRIHFEDRKPKATAEVIDGKKEQTPSTKQPKGFFPFLLSLFNKKQNDTQHKGSTGQANRK